MKKEEMKVGEVYWMYYHIFTGVESLTIVKCLRHSGKKPIVVVLAKMGGIPDIGDRVTNSSYRFFFRLSDAKFAKKRKDAIKDVLG